MRTTLFYFSATGNSLTTAKLLASELGNCHLVGLASLWNQMKIPVRSEAIGFVFPIYYGDMPVLMRKVIERMEFEGSPYIFSVCTYRGYYGDITQRLDELLRTKGQKLSFSTHVPMPGNSRLSTQEQNTAILKKQLEHVQRISEELRFRPVENYRSEKKLAPTPVHMASNMRGLEAEESCVGCGICARICPMENVRILDGHAMFGENCCSCLACFHWCPQKAIWMPKAEEEVMKRRPQYRHPDVTMEEILAQKNSRGNT